MILTEKYVRPFFVARPGDSSPVLRGFSALAVLGPSFTAGWRESERMVAQSRSRGFSLFGLSRLCMAEAGASRSAVNGTGIRGWCTSPTRHKCRAYYRCRGQARSTGLFESNHGATRMASTGKRNRAYQPEVFNWPVAHRNHVTLSFSTDW